MGLPTWCNDTLMVSRPGVKQSRGVNVKDWEHPVTHMITGCSVQPQAESTDYSQPAQPTRVTCVAYVPSGADIQRGDKVTFEGADFRVETIPVGWRSPFGRASHMTVNLTEWEA
ncbi:hypothetical protein HMPREF9244_01542 [Alloscardovia omnicolens F0580]|uniref:Phage head-tail adaptor n=2 Tax=Alloscardovia omnicolens TaxID=419015 RepID=U1SGF8_9BIFI|nr:hypothetical protein HMPREF9244_01542 [Alloscardovia omnicolens F0580]